MTHAQKIHDLTGKSLKVLEKTLEMDCQGDAKKLNLQQGAAVVILNSALKLDQMRVQKTEVDTLTKLLDCLRRGERATFLDGDVEGPAL